MIIPIVGLFAQPDLYGQVILLSTMILVIMGVAGFGQQRSVLYFKADAGQASHVAVVVGIGCAVVLAALTVGLFSAFGQSVPPLIWAAAVANVIHLLVTTQARAFQAFRSFTILRLSLHIFRGLLVLPALLWWGSIELYLIAELLCVILALALQAPQLIKIFRETASVTQENIRRAVHIGGPVMVQILALMVINHFDKFIIESRLGAADLAAYGFVFSLISSMTFLNTFLAMRYEVGIYQAKGLLAVRQNVMGYFFMSAILHLAWVPILCGIYYALFLFSPHLGFYPYLFVLLSLGQIAFNMTHCFSHMFTKLDIGWVLLIVMPIIAVISIVLNTYGVPRFGIAGAALSFAISNSVFLVIMTGVSVFMMKRALQKDAQTGQAVP
ncbi:MAG: hypothetical protein AAF386_00135 [Pseudomonadota bacterium]